MEQIKCNSLNSLQLVLMALALQNKLGPATCKRLYEELGADIVQLLDKNYHHIDLSEKSSAALVGFDIQEYLSLAENQAFEADKHGDHLLFISDVNYPRNLRFCPDAPLVLFVRGNPEALNAARSVAVVGTRKVSSHGRAACTEIVSHLSRNGVAIFSGLAYGVDAQAHSTCMEHKGVTGAFLGHGLHLIYPAAHKKLAKQIIDSGGYLATEFPYHSTIDKTNFLRRNRIIAAVSDATLVVETKEKGGSMVTAAYAQQYNKDVFAVPGRMHDEYSQGCHALIQHQIAQLCVSGEDIIREMGWELKKPQLTVQRSLVVADKYLPIYRHLEQPIHIDELCIKLNERQSVLNAMLTEMELDGLVQIMPGKKVVKV